MSDLTWYMAIGGRQVGPVFRFDRRTGTERRHEVASVAPDEDRRHEHRRHEAERRRPASLVNRRRDTEAPEA